MGDILFLTTVRRRAPRRRTEDGERRGEIALFTGVRVERWSEPPPVDRDASRPPRPGRPRRRGK
jgi:hypothetical protein